MDYSRAIGWRYETMEELEQAKALYATEGLPAGFFDDELRLMFAAELDRNPALASSIAQDLLSKYPEQAEVITSIASSAQFAPE